LGRPVIKVLTGVRRAGKSTLLALLREDLLARGVPADHVLYLDYEVLGLGPLAEAPAMLGHILAGTEAAGRHYLLVDEVQQAEGWERVIPAVMAQRDVDVVVTGSNSRMLSSELATFIAGRYVAFEVWPLSFREHLAFKEAEAPAGPPGPETAGGGGNRQKRWTASEMRTELEAYIRRGGFPVTRLGGLDEAQSDRLVTDIYRSVVLRDVVERGKARQPEMLERIVRFVLDNVGNTFSANALARYFKSQRRPVDPETVHSYLRLLEEAFLIGRAPRFDLRGKELLKTQEKYYAVDHSLIHAVLGFSTGRIQGVLENIVWAELRRRGYEVAVGKVGAQEIDFVADRGGERLFIQVAYLLGADPATLGRERAPLLAAAGKHPSYVVSLDPMAAGTADGIRHLQLGDFLLNDLPNH
jgi:predicted AAA+ superfamily ATPase